MKSGPRKEQLLTIAATIFAEEGYAETTIDRISNEAGITGPAIYRHFSSKQEILDTICISGIKEALQTAKHIVKEGDITAEAILRKLIRSRIDYLFGPTSSYYMLAASQKAHLSDSARAAVSTMQKEFRDICASLLKLIKPSLSDTDVKVSFFAMQCMIIYTAWRYRDRSLLSPSDLKDRLEEINWNTLLA